MHFFKIENIALFAHMYCLFHCDHRKTDSHSCLSSAIKIVSFYDSIYVLMLKYAP